ncbi:MAG TPA: hypothetical protein VEC57_05455 [Candidatus Limnocylindrales bacterium]|nr:hypothetical protein [Candidatus Limnocylindrales bacterium]
MAKSSRSRRQEKHADESHPLLERLKEIASASGLEVREERLYREVGYSVRSGLCRVGEQEVLLLDKNTAAGDRVEVLCSVLSERDLDSVFIEPELRRQIGGRALLADEAGPAR